MTAMTSKKLVWAHFVKLPKCTLLFLQNRLQLLKLVEILCWLWIYRFAVNELGWGDKARACESGFFLNK